VGSARHRPPIFSFSGVDGTSSEFPQPLVGAAESMMGWCNCLRFLDRITLDPNPVLSFKQVSDYIHAMSIEQIAAEALRLPPKERAMLAESLWESLMDPFKVPACAEDSEAVALATERDRQLESGEVQPISHDEMMRRLRR
jgi:putative addiction module component (TIGR02574 family)